MVLPRPTASSSFDPHPSGHAPCVFANRVSPAEHAHHHICPSPKRPPPCHLHPAGFCPGSLSKQPPAPSPRPLGQPPHPPTHSSLLRPTHLYLEVRPTGFWPGSLSNSHQPPHSRSHTWNSPPCSCLPASVRPTSTWRWSPRASVLARCQRAPSPCPSSSWAAQAVQEAVRSEAASDKASAQVQDCTLSEYYSTIVTHPQSLGLPSGSPLGP